MTEFTQPQREALIDLLILSIFVDAHLSLAEDHALHSAIDSLGWGSEHPREIFVLNSFSRGRRASESDDAMAQYVAAHAGAFPEPAQRAEALEQIQKVLESDGLAEPETSFLRHLEAAFNPKG
jgi:hypothetical protein